MGFLLGKIIERSKIFPSKNNALEVKMERLLNHIENDYVDEVDTEDLLDDAIKDMLEHLDPHSVYLTETGSC